MSRTIIRLTVGLVAAVVVASVANGGVTSSAQVAGESEQGSRNLAPDQQASSLQCGRRAIASMMVEYPTERSARYTRPDDVMRASLVRQFLGPSPSGRLELVTTARRHVEAIRAVDHKVTARLHLDESRRWGWRVESIQKCALDSGSGQHRGPMVRTPRSSRDTPTHRYRYRWQYDKKIQTAIDNSVPRRWRNNVRRGFRPWNNRADGDAPRFKFFGIRHLENPFSPCVGPNAVFRRNIRGALAVTIGCVHPGDEQMTGFTMVLDRRHFYTGEGHVPNRRWDLQSIVTHEAGHATGFGLGLREGRSHFDRDSNRCDGRNRATMCQGERGARGNRQLRSLERPDKSAVNHAYYNPCPPVCRMVGPARG